MMELLQSFTDNWKRRRFVSAEGTVLLAVSGGVDSMVMCDLFLQAGIRFAVGHCNFQLRGEDSELDEQLVREWTSKHNIPFHVIRFEAQRSADEWKKGVQETARILRYEWFEEICAAHGYTAVATAHHGGDNAETLLINFFKGTGISGLHGIPEKNGIVIRPLLFAGKAQIMDHARTHGVGYREDVSNTSDKYLRNAVRHHVIPVVEEHFPGVVTRLNENIVRFRQVEHVYRRAIDGMIKKLVMRKGHDIYVPVLKLSKLEPLETICYELFAPYGFSAAQLTSVLQLIEAESGKFIESPTHILIKNRDFIIITTRAADTADFILIESLPATVAVDGSGFEFRVAGSGHKVDNDAAVAMVDTGKLVFPLILRRWKTGDYFYPLGMGMKKKKLSRFFIDQKIPIHEKDRVWVLESEKRIVWVAGMRLDERFKIKDDTQQVMRVVMRPVQE